MIDETFFENLARGAAAEHAGTEAETEASEMGNYEVELARSEGAVTARPSAASRAARTKAEADGPEGQLAVDVYQRPDAIVVEAAIAGVKPDDIDINVTTDSISIKGLRYREEQVGDDDYLYQECYWGRFARSIILPQEVDPDGAQVMFRNGILTIRLPKSSKKRSKRLKVRFD